MKRLITCMALLLVVEFSFVQQTYPTPTMSQKDYLNKSRGQKAGAWLLSLIGVAVLVGTTGNHLANSISNVPPPFPIVPVALGAGCIGGSIALFRGASINKKKSLDASATFNFHRVPTIYSTASETPFIPALSVKIMMK